MIQRWCLLYFMSRSQSYRPRIPTHIIQLLDVASRITLFLVGQNGPLCFTFKDRLDNKYKTSIGPQLKCSCAPGRNDHCIHTAYVFLKVFRVSVDNPIIWQAAYVDSELSDLVTWKHTVRQVRRPRPTFEDFSFDLPTQLPSELLKKRQQIVNQQIAVCERMSLEADSVCPICQDAMTSEMCLSYCKVKCGNNFHLQCLKVWARHRAQEDAHISCPMCRSRFSSTVVQQLEQEERNWARSQTQKIKIQFNCAGCGVKNIPKNPHKCLLCTSFELCECCYAAKKHIKHPFIRRDADGRWRGAEERREDQLKLKNYIDNKRKENYNDEILKKIRKIDEDPAKLIDFVAGAYPFVSRYITQKIDPMKKMDFDPTDIRCLKCGAKRMLFLRRLSCGHFIDHECLKDCLLKGKYHCQEDGTQFLKGYENLRQREKEIDQQRNQQMINLAPVEFDPSPLERVQVPESVNFQQSSNDYDYNFTASREGPSLHQVLSSRSNSTEHTINRVGQRLSSQLIRDPSPRNSIEQQVRQQEAPQVTRVGQGKPVRRTPGTRARPNIPKPPDIRIRNVSVANKQKQPQTRVRQERRSSMKGVSSWQRKGRQEMGGMIQALIGRKLK